jgi:hypothetical protein
MEEDALVSVKQSYASPTSPTPLLLDSVLIQMVGIASQCNTHVERNTEKHPGTINSFTMAYSINHNQQGFERG